MGRIWTSARRATTKVRSLFPQGRCQREPPASICRSFDDDEVLSNARSPHANDLAGPSPPAVVARPSRSIASAGFRFLATNNSTSTVSSCSFKRTASLERRHRYPASDDDDDEDGHGKPSSAPDASDDYDPRLEERSDTSSLFGTHNPWHTSAARGPKAEEKTRKFRLPSFVRNRAAVQREEEEELPKRVELGDEEWELHPNEVGPIQFLSQDLFAQSNNIDFRPRCVDKRRFI